MQTPTNIILRRERDFGEVLSVTFQFLRQNAGPLVKSLLFIAGPAMALSVVVNPFAGSTGLLLNPEELLTSEGGFGTATFWVRVAVGTLLSYFGMMLAVAVVNEFVVLYQARGPGGFEVEDVWRQARRSVWKVLGTVLLLAVFFVVPAVIVIIPCLGALAYLVGVVYFTAALSLAFIVQAQEEAGVFASLGRSRALVRDRFWPTLGVAFVSGIIYYALSVCFAMPSLVLTGLTAFHGIEGEAVPGVYGVLMKLFGVAATLGGLLTYAVPLVALAFQYFSLVEQKERTGLMERVEAMAQAAPTSEATSEAPSEWTSGPTSAEPEAHPQPPYGPIAPPPDVEEAPNGRPEQGGETDVRHDASDAGRSA